jgi:hypothetical protein
MMDKGPWRVRVFGRNVYIESADYSHDAYLEVYGKFMNTKEREAYADQIADALNHAIVALAAAGKEG